MLASSLMSKEKADEICKHIKENAGLMFGQKLMECRYVCVLLIQQRPDRWEIRFLAVTKFRVSLLQGKSVSALKIERQYNILALRYIELLERDQMLQIGWEERSNKSTAVVNHQLFRFSDDFGSDYCQQPRELALELLCTMKHYFPEIQKSLARQFLLLSPSLAADFPLLATSTPELPCHNFRRSYVAYCDWLEHPFREEVIWDIERIYFVHAQHELDLNDFCHLSAKDQQALIGAVQYSDFFTGILADSLRFQAEQVDALILLLRRSHSLKSLQLTKCSLPKDFLSQLATSLTMNLTVPLERLKFSGIPLEDRKGLAQLAMILPQLPQFHCLYLTACSLNEKSTIILLHGLHHGIETAAETARAEELERGNGRSSSFRFQLKTLDLSGNPLGACVELAEQLANLVALGNGALRLLDLSGTAIQLDRLWAALKLGAMEIEVLRLDACCCSSPSSYSGKSAAHRNAIKDIPEVVRELFSTMRSLRELSLANTHIGPELLQGILSGLSTNRFLTPGALYLCLDSTIAGSSHCVSILAQHIPECHVIGSLSLRDNSLEHEAFGLITALGQSSSLKVLDIGGINFFGLRSNKKHAPVLAGILTELIKIINGDFTKDDVDDELEGIEELSLADARLGSHLGVLLNALGLCGRLRRLDLSNNELGPYGARLLSKSLQLNHSLRWLSLDRNQFGLDGFIELARSLRQNTTLVALPMPFVDIADAMAALSKAPAERTKLQRIIEEIEMALERNKRLATASTGLITGHFVQRIIHQLNHASERYNVSGCGTQVELKKAAFHKINKMLVKLGEKNGAIDEKCQDDEEFIKQFMKRIGKLTDKNGERFVYKFMQKLADEEGIEISLGDDWAVDHLTTKRLDNELEADLKTLINKYMNEFAWTKLFSALDHCLSTEDAQKVFQVHERSPLTNNIRLSSICKKIQKNGSCFSGDHLLKAHRPVSSMLDSTDANIVFVSHSMMDDFPSEQRHNNNIQKTCDEKLLHLSKQRPKPARLNRRARVKPTVLEEKSGMEVERRTFDENGDWHLLPNQDAFTELSSSDALADSNASQPETKSLERMLEHSPLMQLQRRKHLADREDEVERTTSSCSVRPMSTPSPPTLPPRREKSASSPSTTPPKLPPKPLAPSKEEDED